MPLAQKRRSHKDPISFTEFHLSRDLPSLLFSNVQEFVELNMSGSTGERSFDRGCWHRVSRCLFLRYRHCFFSEKRSSQPVGLLPPRGIAPSGFRPLRKIPHCCLP
ncbi:hypothetical protein HPP92_018373 [Vanilla planifolia]|uniref:Uncharacterized protein n=1 Tax=Vanilla planifolia TaxID=51239 RepID=A0A835UMC5_VANPL|nr:hypothetical protein HPP92_018373 [Vanilla planifolia]